MNKSIMFAAICTEGLAGSDVSTIALNVGKLHSLRKLKMVFSDLSLASARSVTNRMDPKYLVFIVEVSSVKNHQLRNKLTNIKIV